MALNSSCLRDGVIAGTIAGLVGGIPSALTLGRDDLNESIRSIAHLIPGDREIESPKGRWMLGAATHMVLSVGFAAFYVCRVGKRPLVFASALWLINIKLLAPDAMKRQDRSRTLADHLAWGAALGAVTSRLQRSKTPEGYA